MDDPRPTRGAFFPRRLPGQPDESTGLPVEASAQPSTGGPHEQPSLAHLPEVAGGHEHQLGVHAALEVCRPDTADLDDPALAEVQAELAADADLQRRLAGLQQFDQALATALRDVPAPAGLEDRLLKALAVTGPSGRADPLQRFEADLLTPASATACTTSAPAAFAAENVSGNTASIVAAQAGTADGPPAPARVARRHARRPWIAMAVAIGLGAVAFGLVIRGYMRPRPLPTPQQLASEATGQFQQDLDQDDWMPTSKKWPTDAPPSFPHLRLPPVTKWRTCRLAGVRAVMFDLTQAGTKGALYVVPLPAVAPGGQVPNTLTRVVFTQGTSRTMWRQGDYLCVLTVEGDEQALRRMLRPVPSVA